LGWILPEIRFFQWIFHFEIHTHPIIQPSPLFWVKLDEFDRINWVCPTHIYPYVQQYFLYLIGNMLNKMNRKRVMLYVAKDWPREFHELQFFLLPSSYKTKQKIEPVDLKYHVPNTFSTAIVTTAYSYDANWLVCSPKKTEPPPKTLTWCQLSNCQNSQPHKIGWLFSRCQ
jgi:hypothetical protein